jgi:hypothetical protein
MAVERRQIRHHDRSDQKMGGDGRRDQGERPALSVMHSMQIDGGAMEAHAKAENGEHERAADHTPTVKCSGFRGHRLNVSPPRNRCYGDDRSVGGRHFRTPLVNLPPLGCRQEFGVLRMDMSLVMAVLANQQSAVQSQVATSVLKSNLDAQKSAVETLLGGAQQTLSLANAGPGVGGSINIAA